MKKQTVALVLAVALVIGCSMGGTMAWLTSKTNEVKNVFTTSDIDITLDESALNEDGLTLNKEAKRVTRNENYKMIPGWTIEKDPMVTLDKDSEACYLFIKVEEDLGSWSDNDTDKSFTDYLSYSIDDTVWTAVAEQVGIYYKKVDTGDLKDATDDLTFKIIKNDTITVSGENVTKEMMEEIDGEGNGSVSEKKPTLTFKAAAVQLYETQGKKFDVTAALAKVDWPE